MSLLLTLSGSSASTFTYAGTGGILFAGAGEVSRSITCTASGGVMFAGTSAIAITHVTPVTGGKVFGGSAVTGFVSAGAVVFSYSPSGGITFSGNASASVTPAAAEGGGSIWQWAGRRRAPIVPSKFEHEASGGLSLGGSARVSRTRSIVARIHPRRSRAASRVSFARVPKTSAPRVTFSGRSRCSIVSVPVFKPARKVDTAAIIATASRARRTREEAEVAMILSTF